MVIHFDLTLAFYAGILNLCGARSMCKSTAAWRTMPAVGEEETRSEVSNSDGVATEQAER